MHRLEAQHQAEKLLKFFEGSHLPEDLRAVSADCGNLARAMANLPDNAEKVAGLRKLLEAKDCFVRAVVEARPKVKDAKPIDFGELVRLVEGHGCELSEDVANVLRAILGIR